MSSSVGLFELGRIASGEWDGRYEGDCAGQSEVFSNLDDANENDAWDMLLSSTDGSMASTEGYQAIAPSSTVVNKDTVRAVQLPGRMWNCDLAHGHNKVAKGSGPESRTANPDPKNEYNYQQDSETFRALQAAGLRFTNNMLFKATRALHNELMERHVQLNVSYERMVTRLLARNFKWIDENWDVISPAVGSIPDWFRAKFAALEARVAHKMS